MAADSNGDDILEGFLCPICMKDLVSPSQLSSHFEEFHREDKDILKQLRSVFGRAKNKLLKKEEPASVAQREDVQSKVVSKGTPGSGGIDLDLWQPQSLGKSQEIFSDLTR